MSTKLHINIFSELVTKIYIWYPFPSVVGDVVVVRVVQARGVVGMMVKVIT